MYALDYIGRYISRRIQKWTIIENKLIERVIGYIGRLIEMQIDQNKVCVMAREGTSRNVVKFKI